MSTLNEENLVSVDDINEAIENFIGKHPENVTTWVDGDVVTIQISNIGVRDKLFPRITYLVKNTSIKNNLQLFDMPAVVKCTYISNQIIRFSCTLDKLAIYFAMKRQPTYVLVDTLHDPRATLVTPPIKKFLNRLVGSNSLESNGIEQLVDRHFELMAMK